jgi:hypothetical protein
VRTGEFPQEISPPDVLVRCPIFLGSWDTYARRTSAERGFATAKDPATNDISRGWCRLTGLAPLMLFVATLLVVRNQRILHAWNTRQQENAGRAAKARPPKPGAGAARPSTQSPPPGHPDPPG